MTAASLREFRRPLLATALALILALLAAAVFEPHGALQAWYAATVFWTGISVGGLAILMLHHLTSGAWGWHLRPLLRAAAQTLPLVLLAYVPLLIAMDMLFPWTEPRHTLPEIVQKKTAYLNEPFFLARMALYAAIWGGFALLLTTGRSVGGGERRLGSAAAGLILYALTITFYGVDWIHSLQPTFYSSAVGYVMATGQFVGALAFVVLIAVLMHTDAEEPAPFHDLGNLLLAAVMLWTYIVFSKYLIIWIADLPHEIEWYVRRQSGGWLWLTLLLIVLHFCLPFVLLLFRRIKRSPRLLAGVAALLLIAHGLDVYWLVLPSFDTGPGYAGLIYLLAVAGLGALWMAWFLARLAPLTNRAESPEGSHG